MICCDVYELVVRILGSFISCFFFFDLFFFFFFFFFFLFVCVFYESFFWWLAFVICVMPMDSLCLKNLVGPSDLVRALALSLLVERY